MGAGTEWLDELFSKSKWSILRELSRGPKSASEIAKKTGMSTANATVHLRLLEAQGVIKKTGAKIKPGKAGKPKTPYELIQEATITGVLKPGLAELKTTKIGSLNEFQRYLLNIQLQSNDDSQYALMKHSCETNLLKKADAIGLVSDQGNEIELFIVMETGLLEYREKHSNSSIEGFGKTKKIISWSHNKKEVEEGLAKGEEYFIKLARGSKELYDRKGLLSGWRQK